MRSKAKSALGAMTAVLVASVSLLIPAAAPAQQTDMYAGFTKCPVDAPVMNDAANLGVVCASALVRSGALRVGNFQVAITSPMHLQFAFAERPGEVGEEGEEGEPELVMAPGGTSFEAAPVSIPNPFYVPPPATAPTPPAKKKANKHKKKHHKGKQRKGKHRKHKHGKKGKKGKGKPVKKGSGGQQPATPPAQGDPYVTATFEAAGDMKNLNLNAVFGEPGPLYELPIKLHLQGSGLGPNCFIGTDAAPIVLAPLPAAPFNSFGLATDPNGFGLELLTVGGGSLEDATFAVPAARGCGTVDPATQDGSLDAQINGLIGLPAPAGTSKAILGNLQLQMVATMNDGTPPDGGATLKAAFQAAQ